MVGAWNGARLCAGIVLGVRAGVLGVVLVVAFGVVGTPSPARAQTTEGDGLDPAALGLEVTVGYGENLLAPGRWTPVLVRLAPNRAFAGEVRVRSATDTGSMVARRQVEVPGGAVKAYRFLVPPSTDLQVEVVDGDERTASVRPRSRTVDGFLVGVLGDALPEGLPPVTSSPVGTDATFVALAPDWVEYSSRALHPLGTLVTSREALAALSPSGRDAVAAAVGDGMALTVTVTAPGDGELGLPWTPIESVEVPDPAEDVLAPLARLVPAPAAWPLTIAGSPDVDPATGPPDQVLAAALPAGRGRVAVVGTALGSDGVGAAGLWGALLQPASISPTSQADRFDGQDEIARTVSTAQDLLQSGRVEVPGLGLLGLFLLAYVLVVGPINGVVLSRLGRRELAWVTIPVITVVFSVGAFATSARTQPTAGVSAGAAYWIDGVGTQVRVALLRTPTGGTPDVTLPGNGWDVVPAAFSQPIEVVREAEATRIELRLEALEVGSVLGWRGTSETTPLQVELDVAGDRLTATVTNVSGGPIGDLRLRAGSAVAEGPDALAPGASATIELAASELPLLDAFGDEFAGVRDFDGNPDQPLALASLLRWTTIDDNPGIVWVTGTRPEAPEPVTTDGRPTEEVGELVAVGTTPRPQGRDVTPVEVQRELLTSGPQLFRAGPTAVEGEGTALLRFRLPYPGSIGELVTSLDRSINGGFGPGGEPGFGADQMCRTEQMIDTNGNVIGETETCEALPDVGADEPDLPDGVPGDPSGVEIYDFAAAAWVGLDASVTGPGSLAYVGPLGEVYARAAGQFGLFDFSGRGVTVTGGGS